MIFVINFLIRTLQFVIFFLFVLLFSRTILKLRYKRSLYRLDESENSGIIYKRDGKTEVERGLNTRGGGEIQIY